MSSLSQCKRRIYQRNKKDGMTFKGHGWKCNHCGKGFDGEYKANIGGQTWTMKW